MKKTIVRPQLSFKIFLFKHNLKYLRTETFTPKNKLFTSFMMEF